MGNKKITQKQKPPLSIGADFGTKKFACNTCIDWLQIDSRGVLNFSKHFRTTDTSKSTSVFKKIYEIWEDKYYIASIVSEPIEKFLPENMNLIKLINRELYYKNPVQRIIAISMDHCLLPYRPSRIDIAIDFNYFCNGLHPIELINRFYNCKYIKKGHSNYIIQGKQTTEQQPHYLKFTKKDAQVSTYLYNKTKELKDVKNKPWIVDSWKRAGLDLTQDIWRLEFSIHSPKFNYTNKITGETKQFNYENLDNKEELNEIIRVFISKYFDFRINDNQQKISRMQKLILFKGIKEIEISFDRSQGVESDRGDRNFIKRLKSLNIEVRDKDLGLGYSAEQLINYYKKTRQI